MHAGVKLQGREAEPCPVGLKIRGYGSVQCPLLAFIFCEGTNRVGFSAAFFIGHDWEVQPNLM